MARKNRNRNLNIEKMRDNLEFIDYSTEETNETSNRRPGRVAKIKYSLVRTSNNRVFFTGTVTEFTNKYFEFASPSDVKNKKREIRYSGRTGRPIFGGKVIAFVNEE